MLLAGDFFANGCSVVLPSKMNGRTLLANLEAPLIDEISLPPAEFKSGPCLWSSGLGLQQDNDIRLLFSLANNHIMDYGVFGLSKTIQCLDKAGIGHFGAGLTLSEACEPIVIQDNGVTIGIIGCREAQFGSSNCADFGWWIFDVIKDLRSRVDKVVVSAHAAAEDLPFPSPAIRRLYRRFIDAGADVVHGHHSHVPQGWESYQNGLIFYGLGNFVVDPSIWPNPTNRWSLVADIDFTSETVDASISYFDCIKDGKDCIVIREKDIRKGDDNDKYIEICKRALVNDKLIEGYWQESACRLYERTYGIPLCYPSFKSCRLDGLGRIHFIIEGVRRIAEGLVGRRIPSRRSISAAANVYNCMQCLSHSEMIKTAMGIALGNINEVRDASLVSDCDFIFSFLDGK